MSPPSRASLDAIDSDEDYVSVIATNQRGLSVDTKLVEEYLVPHFRVAKQLTGLIVAAIGHAAIMNGYVRAVAIR